MQKCRNHKHAERNGQHALTILTAHSSRRHSPARCRSGSSSTIPCPRPDTVSMQPPSTLLPMPSAAPIPPINTPTAAEEHQCRNAETTNTHRERPTCTHKYDSPLISPTLSGKVPLRLVENKFLPAPRHSQHAATHPRFYPCRPQPPYPQKYNHRCRGTSMQKCRNHNHAERKGNMHSQP